MLSLDAVRYVVILHAMRPGGWFDVDKAMKEFDKFMDRQTVAVGPNGQELYYLHDVKVFMRIIMGMINSLK